MHNYYSILGIRLTASLAEIKSAYKKLAKIYHPDKNPGNAAAEEKFKVINEAYHVLIDYTERARYDRQFESTHTTHRHYDYKRTSWNQPRQPNHREERPYYKVDRTYFKNQGLAVLTFIVIGGFCLMITQSIRYIYNQKKAKEYNHSSTTLRQVNALFSSGKIKEAFGVLNNHQENGLIDSRFRITYDSLLNQLQNRAQVKYKNQHFSGAITDYLTLRQMEKTKALETTLKIAQCQYALENYNEAVLELQSLISKHPNDCELLYEISLIYLNDIHNPEEALQYLSKGKMLIQKKSMVKKDSSFQFTVDPEDTPDVYFEIFEASAETNIALNRFEDATEDCTIAIYLRPTRGELYKLRAMCNVGNNKKERACADLEKAEQLRVENITELKNKYCQ